MKKAILFLTLLMSIQFADAQITVTAADMPVSGDTLRFSFASPTDPAVDISTTGANTTWDFSGLVPVAQNIDAYKTALQVNASYALTISPTAYGYKIADTLPGVSSNALPVTVTNIYNFFSKKNSPSRFVAEAFAANISGLPTPINYSNEDEWYYFPLQFGNIDSSDYALSYSIGGLGGLVMNGTRKTTVDGWGTIKTPFFSTPVNCIRVKTVINEIDTVTISTTSMGIPRNSIEYKWLVNGEHYPALWITTKPTGSSETVTNVRYRDNYQATSVKNVALSVQKLNAYPIPVKNELHISIPETWKQYSVEIFDIAGKLVNTSNNKNVINCNALASGQYIARVTSENNLGFVIFNK